MASIAPCRKPRPKPNWSVRVQASPTSRRRSGCGQGEPIGGSAATVGTDEMRISCPPPGGGKISGAFRARYRSGLTHRLFLAAGGLDYFPEIKHFKAARLTRPMWIASPLKDCGKRRRGRAPRPDGSALIYFSGPRRADFAALKKNAAKLRVGGS